MSATEIELAEVRRPLHLLALLGREPGFGCDRPRQLLDAPHLLAHGPELLVEHDPLELGDAVLELRLPVLLEEEPGVGEAGAHHAVVALDDRGKVERRVHDGHVVRQKLVVPRFDAEVALVPAGDGADDRRGQGEEGGVERASDDVRLLDERGVLEHEQRGLVVGAPRRLRRCLDLGHHGGLALGAVHDDVPSSQGVDVSRGFREVERLRGEEAVPARAPPAPDPGELEVDGVPAEQRDEPLHGPPEGGRAAAPAHRLAERDRRADVGERLAQHLTRRSPLEHPPPGHVPPGPLSSLRGLVQDDQRGERDSELVRERLRGSRRLAVLVRRGLGGADDLLVHVWLPRGDIRHEDREPARRSEGAHRAVRDATLGQLRLRQIRQGGQRAVDERSREFLDADFEEEGRGREV